MGYDKLVDSAKLDGALTATADKIRSIKSSTDSIPWDADTGFADALDGISGGGGNDDMVKQLVEGTITEFVDDTVTSVKSALFVKISNMDSNNLSITSNNHLKKVNLPNAESIGAYAFNKCSELTTVNCPKLKTIDCYAFYNCGALKEFVAPEVTRVGYCAFSANQSYNCLEYISFPKCTTIGQYAFRMSKELKNAYLPALTNLISYAFSGCAELTYFDGVSITNIASSAFDGCSKLSTLILRVSEKICTVYNTYAFDGTPFASGGTGGIVLCPATLIPQYMNATNWSTLHAAGTCRFLPLEGYTVDGTTTGEINWAKLEADREEAFA